MTKQRVSEKFRYPRDPSVLTTLAKIGYTAKTLIYPLSDQELKLISKWASITLSEALGMPSRPTNAELEERYQLEVCGQPLCTFDLF